MQVTNEKLLYLVSLSLMLWASHCLFMLLSSRQYYNFRHLLEVIHVCLTIESIAQNPFRFSLLFRSELPILQTQFGNL